VRFRPTFSLFHSDLAFLVNFSSHSGQNTLAVLFY